MGRDGKSDISEVITRVDTDACNVTLDEALLQPFIIIPVDEI